MSNRYSREWVARALQIASSAATTDDFAIPHTGHPPGTCLDCDAQRLLISTVETGLSLHQIRRTLGGHGGKRDPLQPPLLGIWCATFPNRQATEGAELDAVLEGERTRRGIVMPKLTDPDDALSLERRISIDFEEVETIRAQVEEWAANFGGEITDEEIRLQD